VTSSPVVVSLCDITGVFTTPWVEAGCDVVLVDPQHGLTRYEGQTMKVAATVNEALPLLADLLRTRRIVFVAAFPPCTELATSGSAHWARKSKVDPWFQSKAIAVAEQCRTFAELTGAPYFVENPRSSLSRVFGAPDHSFDPWEYTQFEAADNYSKFTCLWTGGGFRMPPRHVRPGLGDPVEFVMSMAGSHAERGNARSVTPLGFSRAVFEANYMRALALS
jgi:hypothetical protein